MIYRMFRAITLFRKSSDILVRKKRKSRQSGYQADLKLKSIWLDLRQTYFPELQALDSFCVAWSRRRQKRTLASCHLKKQVVLVAKELNYPWHEQWLEPLIYHELCHAALGDKIAKFGKRRAWHGKEFKILEARHPQIRSLNQWIKSGGWSKAVRSDRARRRWIST